MECPECGGEMYDNRETKTNPRQPDFKCKNYKGGCKGVIWPQRSKTPQTMGEYNKENGYDLPAAPTGYEKAKEVRESLVVSPEERSRRIERQHSQDMAIETMRVMLDFGLVIDKPETKDDLLDGIKTLTDWFAMDLNRQ